MTQATCTDQEFIELWKQIQSPSGMSKAIGVDVRAVIRRRNYLEGKYNISLATNNPLKQTINFDKNATKQKLAEKLEETRHSVRRGAVIENGTVVVFSDAHFYPNDYSTAFRALLTFIKAHKPEVIINNGDAFDGASISRHPRIGWDSKPSVIEELKAVQEHLTAIEEASVHKSNFIWTLGNHDARFENFLAAQAPHYEGVQGFTLKDHFPLWQPCWSFWVNDDTVIKHRWKGGRYAGSNNTTFAGTNIITGHTHQLKVEPFTDYNGTRYGVQTGCLANPMGDQFVDYTEDNPKDWRSGFAVLTFVDGKLLPPELIQVWDEDKGEVTFRGKIWTV